MSGIDCFSVVYHKNRNADRSSGWTITCRNICLISPLRVFRSIVIAPLLNPILSWETNIVCCRTPFSFVTNSVFSLYIIYRFHSKSSRSDQNSFISHPVLILSDNCYPFLDCSNSRSLASVITGFGAAGYRTGSTLLLTGYKLSAQLV